MRVNRNGLQYDGFEWCALPDCPDKSIKEMAEKLLNMSLRAGFALPSYNTVTELDKHLLLAYWKEYCGFLVLFSDNMTVDKFENWFMDYGEFPEALPRARRWLVQHNYWILPDEVMARAMKAADAKRNLLRVK